MACNCKKQKSQVVPKVEAYNPKRQTIIQRISGHTYNSGVTQTNGEQKKI